MQNTMVGEWSLGKNMKNEELGKKLKKGKKMGGKLQKKNGEKGLKNASFSVINFKNIYPYPADWFLSAPSTHTAAAAASTRQRETEHTATGTQSLVCLSLSICLFSVYRSFCLSVYLSVIRLSVYLSIYLPVCLSIALFASLCLFLSL